MHAFAELVDKLYFTSSTLAKSALIQEYLRNTPDPDRGWAIAAIAGTLNFEFFKRKLIKDLIVKRVDPVLFDLSYDYVGEMSETVAHLWEPLDDDPKYPPNQFTSTDALPSANSDSLPSLSEVVETFQTLKKNEIESYLITLLNSMDASQRWALIKLGTGGLRIGVSARLLKKVLAQYAQQYNDKQSSATTYNVEEVERLWHGVTPPYQSLFAWLEGKADKPDVSKSVTFQPVMLSHPLEEEVIDKLLPHEWIAEWKFDGIRVQLVISEHGKALFSRTGDDISHSFPDVLDNLDAAQYTGVFDGELLALTDLTSNTHDSDNKTSSEYQIASFNQLQQRLNKKRPTKKLMTQIPAGIMLYDCLRIAHEDLRERSLAQRQLALFNWYNDYQPPRLLLSKTLTFDTIPQLRQLRDTATQQDNGYIEGLMLKHVDSIYQAGRPKNKWFKWKRDPLVIDAVMMYAQRGHGKRSSFYSDYTFGCWKGEQLLPVGKAYSGFTDVELKKIDKWIRANTMGRFGPVKEVKKELVFELAFDAVHLSNRHKSGLALRFPRVHRIRWDKPASEADTVDALLNMCP